jgi:hypothetical protein
MGAALLVGAAYFIWPTPWREYRFGGVVGPRASPHPGAATVPA